MTAGRTVLGGCAALLLLMMAVPAAARDVGDTAMSDVADSVIRHITEGMEANGVPGAAVALVLPDGEVEVRGFGATGRGGHPVTSRTPFLIGSVTKSITALAVVHAAEQGWLDLDAPLTDVLPWFAVEPAEQTSQVTIRTLLQHTSGLGALAGGPAIAWQEDLPIETTARAVVGSPLQHAPGAAFIYANANYVLLGAALEAVTGRPYAEVIDEVVLTPLGMERTFVDLGAARAAGMADGHRYWFGRPVAHLSAPRGLVPSGLLVSTAEDLSRYLEMLVGRGSRGEVQIVSEAGFDVLTGPAAEAQLGPWAQQPTASYAAGWYVGGAPFGVSDAVFHPGASPDFAAMAAFSPEQGSAIAVLMNVGPRTNLPGAVGAVDRIGAGAVSLLLGAEPATGGTMREAYLRIDLALAAIVALLLGLLARSLRGLRRRRRAHRGMAVVSVVMPLLLGAAVLASPLLFGGWQQSALWVPDLTLAVAVIGALLLAVGFVQLLRAWAVHRTAGPPAGDAADLVNRSLTKRSARGSAEDLSTAGTPR